MMREMGVRCGIRRETDYHRYNSYRDVVGEPFENVIGRDAGASQRYGLAVPTRDVDEPREGGEDNAGHVAQGQLPGQRRRRAGLRPHEGRVLPGKDLAQLRVLRIRS